MEMGQVWGDIKLSSKGKEETRCFQMTGLGTSQTAGRKGEQAGRYRDHEKNAVRQPCCKGTLTRG